MANQVPAQPSLLDRLRERASTSLQDENVRRLSEFGTGMLSSNSPNFFTMLGAGFRAQEAGDASRMEQLRRAVEAERQEQARQDEARYRQDQIRLTGEGQADTANYRQGQLEIQRRQAAIAAQRPPVTIGVRSDGTIVQLLSDGQIVDRPGVMPIPLAAADARAETARDAAAAIAGRNAVSDAVRLYATNNPGQELTEAQKMEIFRNARDRHLLAFPGATPTPTAGAPATGTPAAPGTTMTPETYRPPNERR